MKYRSQINFRHSLILAGIAAFALAVGLAIRPGTVRKPEQGLSRTGSRAQGKSEVNGSRHESRRRERPGKELEERQAALELAGKIGENQSLISSDRMPRVGDKPRFPFALFDEAARMSPTQLRVLVGELGIDPQITGPNREILVMYVTDTWLKAHEAEKAKSLRVVLKVIAEVLPTLPPGFDTLPVSCAMGRSLEWDHATWTDFFETHWSRWGGSGNAESMRRDLLKVLDDPELRLRVEKLR